MHKVKFTIITVCLNAEKSIESTILSVLGQTNDNYEYIIKDGGSTDQTLDIVNKLTGGNSKVRVICGRDKGIYDAMNQSISFGTGEYVYFLNSGDCFIDCKVLEKAEVFLDQYNVDIAYGNIISVDGQQTSLRKYGNICTSRVYYLAGACICHQSMFARTDLFREKAFDLNYKVCADREWQLYQLKQKRKFKSMGFAIASVPVEGFSSRNVERLELEIKDCLKKHYSKNVWVYNLIVRMKKNKTILSMIRFLERKIFT